MKVHLGQFIYEIACDQDALDGDTCDEDIEEVTCLDCLSLKRQYVSDLLARVQARLAALKTGGKS